MAHHPPTEMLWEVFQVHSHSAKGQDWTKTDLCLIDQELDTFQRSTLAIAPEGNERLWPE